LSTTTPKAGLPAPGTGDSANGPSQIGALATALDGTAGAYGSTAARDSANPTPASNDLARAAGVLYVYRSSAWHLIPDADQGPAWTTMSLSSGWSATYSGAIAPSYRLNGGKIEFKGVSTYTGAMTTAGIQLCTAIAVVAAAVPAAAGNFYRRDVTGMTTTDASTNSVPGFTARFVSDGRIFIHPPAGQTNAVICLEGLSISQ
jgi:hypothetical protein